MPETLFQVPGGEVVDTAYALARSGGQPRSVRAGGHVDLSDRGGH